MSDVITGTRMDVDVDGSQVEHAASWSLSPQADKKKYTSNVTGAIRKTALGPLDFTIEVTVYFHDDNTKKSPFKIGSEHDVELHVDDSGLNYYSTTVKCSSLGTITCDPDTAEPISQTAMLDSHGADITPVGDVPDLTDLAAL